MNGDIGPDDRLFKVAYRGSGATSERVGIFTTFCPTEEAALAAARGWLVAVYGESDSFTPTAILTS